MTAVPPPSDPYGTGGTPGDRPADPYPAPAPVDPAYGQPHVPPAPSPYASAPSPSAPYEAAPYGSAPYPPAPYPPAAYGQPGAYPPRGTDGVSIAALVTGILTLGIVPLVLGIIGVRRTNRSGRGGKGMAIAGIVLGVLSTIGWSLFLVIVVALATDSDARAAFEDGIQQGINEASGLTVGNCLLLPDDLNGGDLPTVVDCDVAHDAEVFAETRMTDSSYPGLEAADSQAVEFCVAEFKAFVGTPYEESALDFIYWVPQATSWRLGDHGIACAVATLDGSQLTGTARGSGQ